MLFKINLIIEANWLNTLQKSSNTKIKSPIEYERIKAPLLVETYICIS